MAAYEMTYVSMHPHACYSSKRFNCVSISSSLLRQFSMAPGANDGILELCLPVVPTKVRARNRSTTLSWVHLETVMGEGLIGHLRNAEFAIRDDL